MDLENKTNANAGLIRTVFGEEHMLAAVIARPTFRIDGSSLVPTPDQPWPVDEGPMETPSGTFPGDVPFLTGGIDVFVVGSVHQPSDQPAPDLQVDISVGPRFKRTIDVFGDRVWEKRRGRLVPSEPEPFVSMPLSYELAYGGAVDLEEGEYKWPANPVGKGLYFTAEQAEGNPLPNLEDPEHPIESFEDRPDAVGTAPYPSEGALKLMNAVELDLESENPHIKQLKPLLFNHAHPRMILEPGVEPRPGEWIEITYARSEGSLRFPMPDLAYHVHVQLEDRSYLFPLHLDQIGILVDELRAFFSLRTVFTYRLVPLERRLATLYPGSAPGEVPADYVHVWES
jgi:hypothetical protein